MNCPRCNAANAETANFCANCGQPFRTAAAPGAPPGAPPMAPMMPVCPMCRSPYLQYFPNGKGTCSTCRYIFGWGYMPTGQVVLYPNPGFTL